MQTFLPSRINWDARRARVDRGPAWLAPWLLFLLWLAGVPVCSGQSFTFNDVLTFKLGAPLDFWLHVGGESGSHVVVRNPGGLDRLPRDTVRFAAALAAGYSKARNAGRVAVHLCQCRDVRKPRGVPAGTVELKQHTTVQVAPQRGSDTD